MSTDVLIEKRHTLADLAREPGKAELVNGRIVRFMATGYMPSRVAGRIFRSLSEYADRTGRGEAFADNTGFTVDELTSGRESFAPDVSYFTGSPPADRMRFIHGAPDLAVEVRSENDYGPSAERDMAAKRADYFEAGTQVVWDVDPESREVRVYRASSPAKPVVFALGTEADAEPAVPGWKVSVDWLFE